MHSLFLEGLGRRAGRELSIMLLLLPGPMFPLFTPNRFCNSPLRQMCLFYFPCRCASFVFPVAELRHKIGITYSVSSCSCSFISISDLSCLYCQTLALPKPPQSLWKIWWCPLWTHENSLCIYHCPSISTLCLPCFHFSGLLLWMFLPACLCLQGLGCTILCGTGAAVL